MNTSLRNAFRAESALAEIMIRRPRALAGRAKRRWRRTRALLTSSPRSTAPTAPDIRTRHEVDEETGTAVREMAPFSNGVISIMPQDVRHRAELSLGFDYKHDEVWYALRGDWDLDATNFDDIDFVRALGDVHRGGEWQSTPFYQRVADEIRAGATKWGCRTTEQFDLRLKFNVDAMVAEMREMGYFVNNNRDQVAVVVGRTGELFFYDGRHRLAAASLLELGPIPAVVVGRHIEWVDFVDQIALHSREHGGRIETPLDHPDLVHFRSVYGHKRYDLIARSRGHTPTPVVDLNPGWGYFCRRFAHDSVRVTAIDPGSIDSHFLRRLTDPCKGAVEFLPDERSLLRDAEKFVGADLLLLGDYAKDLASFTRLRHLTDIVRTTRPRYVFVETANGPRLSGAQGDNPSDDPVVTYISEMTDLDTPTFLGITETERCLVRLSRPASAPPATE